MDKMKEHLKLWCMLGLSFSLGFFMRPISNERLVSDIFKSKEREVAALGEVNQILMQRNALLESKIREMGD